MNSSEGVSARSAIFVPNFPAMRHIIILDDSKKRDRMMLDLARELRDIPVLTTEQWEEQKDRYAAKRILDGLETEVVGKAEVSEAIRKMRAT